MEDQEERIKNKKYRSLKIFPSDIISKIKNIVKFDLNKLLKLKKFYEASNSRFKQKIDKIFFVGKNNIFRNWQLILAYILHMYNFSN